MKPRGEQLMGDFETPEEGQCKAVVNSVWDFEEYERRLKGCMGAILRVRW